MDLAKLFLSQLLLAVVVCVLVAHASSSPSKGVAKEGIITVLFCVKGEKTVACVMCVCVCVCVYMPYVMMCGGWDVCSCV